MASPTYPVYEGYGTHSPKRPTATADLGGLDFSDSQRLPPKNRVELSATDYMQTTMSLERIARMAPTLMANMVLVTSGSPVPATGISCVNNNVLAADVVITNTATGKYTIAYPANKLPSPNMHPIAVIVYGAAV